MTREYAMIIFHRTSQQQEVIVEAGTHNYTTFEFRLWNAYDRGYYDAAYADYIAI